MLVSLVIYLWVFLLTTFSAVKAPNSPDPKGFSYLRYGEQKFGDESTSVELQLGQWFVLKGYLHLG